MILPPRQFLAVRHVLGLVFLVFLSIAGCVGPSYSGWTRISDVNDVHHPVNRSLTEEQVKQAIVDGIETAVGWQADPIENGPIIATYMVRNHTIDVLIHYSDRHYSYIYGYSDGMKIYCTDADYDKHREPKISGQESCPRGKNPEWIHANYKRWIAALDHAIQISIGKLNV
jgi:hypothetical protein